VNESDALAPENLPGDDNPLPETGPGVSTAIASCRQCGTPRPTDAAYCGDCGYIFVDEPSESATAAIPAGLVGERYRMILLVGERDGVARFRSEDVSDPDNPLPVIVVRQEAAKSQPAEPPAVSRPESEGSIFEFDLPVPGEQATEEIPNPADPASWPSIGWEQGVLLRAAHLSLPRLIDTFTENGFTYLVQEVPAGTNLWDAWDREGVTNRDRFTWLIQVAEAMQRLHFAGAILEGLRPEMVTISPNGLAILADIADLLPIPLPGDIPLRGGFATAPELLLNPSAADERADLYAFGALLYALLLSRELSDLDFTLTGMPRPYLERVPDANPFLARVMAKTFVRDISQRFPTDDGAQSDPTGFQELIAALDACRRNLDRVKLDVAAWSSTGMVRSGNEDAVFIFHSAEGRLDASDEAALILLADGMGGMECGEVAAALALQALRRCLLAGPPFGPGLPVTPLPESAVTEAIEKIPDCQGNPAVADPSPSHPPPDSPERTAEVYAERVTTALREANRQVFEAARANSAARGMGCTTEVVLVDGGLAVVGHVGDSRVYRMRRGKLTQVTRDHTIVSRLVELGQITEEEAEMHPRRSELHQATGGRPEVYPDVYAMTLEPGDWLLVCSDGLSNQTPPEMMQAVLREARSAERAARRFVNMALADGALDNVTVAVVRCA
jgi:serine/threonine protein phosphatase PrpC